MKYSRTADMTTRAVSILTAFLLILSVFSAEITAAYAEETNENQETLNNPVNPETENLQTIEVPENLSLPEENLENTEQIVTAQQNQTEGQLPEPIPEPLPEQPLSIEIPETYEAPLQIEVPQNQSPVIELYLDRPENYDPATGTCKDLLADLDTMDDTVITGYDGVFDGQIHIFTPVMRNATGAVEWQWYRKTDTEDLPVSIDEETEKPYFFLAVCEPADSGIYYVEASFMENGEVREKLRSRLISVSIAQSEPETVTGAGFDEFSLGEPYTPSDEEEKERVVEQEEKKESIFLTEEKLQQDPVIPLDITVGVVGEENQEEENNELTDDEKIAETVPALMTAENQEPEKKEEITEEELKEESEEKPEEGNPTILPMLSSVMLPAETQEENSAAEENDNEEENTEKDTDSDKKSENEESTDNKESIDDEENINKEDVKETEENNDLEENETSEENEEEQLPLLAAMPMLGAPLTSEGSVTYSITNTDSEGRIVWIKGSEDSLTVYCDGIWTAFDKLIIRLSETDELTFSSGGISVSAGENNSTIASVPHSALTTEPKLVEGEYTLTLVYNDGEANAKLLVLNKNTSVKVSLKDYDKVYNGQEKRPGVTVTTETGAIEVPAEEYTVVYNNNINAGSSATVTVKNNEKCTFTFEETVSFSIVPAEQKVRIKDKSVYYDRNEKHIDAATVELVNGEKFVGTVTYNYYTDSTCSTRLSSAPVSSGVYYVVAETPAVTNYNAGKSNVAVLHIIYTSKKVTASSSSSTASVISNTSVELLPGESYTFRVKEYQTGYYVGRVYVNGTNKGSPGQYQDGTYYYTYSNTDTDSGTVSVVFQVYDRYGAPATGDESKLKIELSTMLVSCLGISMIIRTMNRKHRKTNR